MNNIRHLKYIVEAARLKSITEASNQLLISQPAISAALLACEQEFGTRIFIRKPSQGLSLTPRGKVFVKRARELLDDVEEFHNLFTESEGDTLAGRLELACAANPAPLLVPPVIQSFIINIEYASTIISTRSIWPGTRASSRRRCTPISPVYEKAWSEGSSGRSTSPRAWTVPERRAPCSSRSMSSID